jgi:hypothetical protein
LHAPDHPQRRTSIPPRYDDAPLDNDYTDDNHVIGSRLNQLIGNQLMEQVAADGRIDSRGTVHRKLHEERR